MGYFDNFPPDTHWRDSARIPKFFGVDARAAFPIFFCLMHIRIWTISLAVASVLFFAIIGKFGFTIPVFFRWLRGFFAGSRKMSIPWWKG